MQERAIAEKVEEVSGLDAASCRSKAEAPTASWPRFGDIRDKVSLLGELIRNCKDKKKALKCVGDRFNEVLSVVRLQKNKHTSFKVIARRSKKVLSWRGIILP